MKPLITNKSTNNSKSLAADIRKNPRPIEMRTGKLGNEIYRSQEWAFGLIDFGDLKWTKYAGVLPEKCVQGDTVDVVGQLTVHPKYGVQFRIDTVISHIPRDHNGIHQWLKMLPQIGPERAKALVTQFGSTIWDVIEKRPQKLTEVKGLTEERVDAIIEAYADVRAGRELVLQLLDFGLTPDFANKALQTWGKDAFDIINKNPYNLYYGIKNSPFTTIDTIALKYFGMPQLATERLEAYCLYILRQETLFAGHCTIMLHALLAKVSTATTGSKEQIQMVLEDSERFVARDKKFVLESKVDSAEGLVASMIGTLYRRRTYDLRDHGEAC